ncbi:hypothetical protein FMJ14_13460 [Klebsiella grimontii]|nr:hypothetical protein [Klebsiella grimontii]QET47863.1 hypothetical protein FOB55_07350 [Klebsiella michiganensis]
MSSLQMVELLQQHLNLPRPLRLRNLNRRNNQQQIQNHRQLMVINQIRLAISLNRKLNPRFLRNTN